MKNKFRLTDYKTIKEIINTATKTYKKDAFILKINKQYKHISYEEFGGDIEAVGAKLISLGLRGKHIAIIGKNSYEWLLGYFGAVCGGSIAVPLDKGLPDHEIETSLKMGDVDAVIYAEDHKDFFTGLKERTGIELEVAICMDQLESFKTNIDQAALEEFRAAAPGPDDIASIVFTSGTTSNAKAVVLSHYNIASNINSINAYEIIYPEDVNIAFLPYHHCFGFTGQLVFIESGATNVYCDGLRYIQKNLQEYHVSCFFCVPLIIESMHKKIWATIDKEGKRNTVEFGRKLSNFLLKFGIDIRRKLFKDIHNALGGRMRLVISGASALDPKVEQDFLDFGIMSIQGYGLTETAPVLCAENPDNLRPGSIGKAIPGVEIRIEDQDENGVGELIARGPNVMKGYYKNETATNEVIHGEWFSTGDYARLDKDGFIYISGRKKNVIVLKNGKNVFPEELETVVAKLPYVNANMVFETGEYADPSIALKIVYNKDAAIAKWPELANDFSEAALKKLVWKDVKEINESLPVYKHISYLAVSEEDMPMTTTQKVKRKQAIEQLKEGELTHISI